MFRIVRIAHSVELAFEWNACREPAAGPLNFVFYCLPGQMLEQYCHFLQHLFWFIIQNGSPTSHFKWYSIPCFPRQEKGMYFILGHYRCLPRLLRFRIVAPHRSHCYVSTEFDIALKNNRVILPFKTLWTILATFHIYWAIQWFHSYGISIKCNLCWKVEGLCGILHYPFYADKITNEQHIDSYSQSITRT